MISLEDLTKNIPNLATYDPILRELEEVLNDPESTLVDVCAIVETDPVLTAKLLKLGNSCFFGFAKRVETVFEAISLFGIQQVRDLVAATAVMRMFNGVSAQQVNPQSFWRHCLACGVAARNLAIALRCPKPERFFVIGLLHDFGRLVLLFQSPATARQIFEHYDRNKITLREVERRLMGYDHAQIAGRVLQGWSYPASLVQAVEHHHVPMLASAFQLEACVIHVADHLVSAMQLGCSGERLIPPLDMPAWKRIGMTIDLIEPVVKSIDDQLTPVEQAFMAAKDRVPEEKLHGKVPLS